MDTTISSIINDFIQIFDLILPILFTLAFVVFVWGIVKFINALGKGDETGVSEGKKVIGWGIIALVAMIFLFSAALFLRNEFGFQGTTPQGGTQGVIPLLPTQ